MTAYEDVLATWDRLSRDGHVGVSDAMRIVAAAANTESGRRALAEILERESAVAIDTDALSYMRISRDLPLPPGLEDTRADSYFRTRPYTGTRTSRSHGIANPNEFLYFNFAIGMLVGTLRDVSGVRTSMRDSGFEPVIVRVRGQEMAIGIIMVNEFRDSTFGPYNELVLMVMAIGDGAPQPLRVIDFVNAYSLQVALHRGATTYILKLWLDQLSPIDGGNDCLGTNKELGCFRFSDRSDATRTFRAWDGNLQAIVSGTLLRMVRPEGAAGTLAEYREAARHAGAVLPQGTVTTISVASRPDSGGRASMWAFAVDWRHAVLQAVTPGQVGLTFGDSAWGRRFEAFEFTPALCFYAPSGVGEILQNIGDAPYDAVPQPVSS